MESSIVDLDIRKKSRITGSQQDMALVIPYNNPLLAISGEGRDEA